MTRPPPPAAAVPRQRLDKWLWHARLARTRTTAQALATSGAVRVNRERTVSASHALKIGDVLTIAIAGGVRVLRVAAFADRRGSADVARALYEDLTSVKRSAD
ncbi:MAG: RNA-binding S4 domain-containing protein [Bauldia sp.]|nr:RNA-binding S4 domain-containing protein [Bauldia sp.]